MFTKSNQFISLIAIACICILFASFYIVMQGQEALLLKLGSVVLDKEGKVEIIQPGLHAHIPLLYRVKKLDMRLQTLDVQASRMTVSSNRNVLVDYYVKWKINDPLLYFSRTEGNAYQAEVLLEEQVNASLRAALNGGTIDTVIADEGNSMITSVNKQAQLRAKTLGVDIIDIGIRRIDLPTEELSGVYDFMRTQWAHVAAKFRAQGKAKAELIRVNADANTLVTVATGKANAAKIRGEGDAEAAEIYADAYDRDPGFYAFYRTLNAYKQIFSNKNDVLVLRPDNQFFKYFNGVSQDQGAMKHR